MTNVGLLRSKITLLKNGSNRMEVVLPVTRNWRYIENLKGNLKIKKIKLKIQSM